MNLSKTTHLLLFLMSTVITGLFAIYLGQDLNLDLLSYHYYNGYAFLNLKLGQDFMPASIQSYLNPLTDALNYLMIKNLPPKLTTFLLGAIQGINFYVLAMMANTLIKTPSSSRNRLIIIVAIALLGLLSANVIGEIGATFNDLTLANWVLLSTLLMGFAFKTESVNKEKTYIFLAGLSLGIAAGLKLTMMIFLPAALIAGFFSVDTGRYRYLALFLLSAGLGFIIVNGYWMILLWKHFHNPLFPYYNQIFKSPYYYLINLEDKRFLPSNILQTLFYPFYFSWANNTNEAPFRDFRLPCVYLLLIIYCFKVLFKKKIYSPGFDSSQKRFIQYLIIFFIISYIVWQYQFSIQRYAMPLDIMAPLLIYVLIVNIFENESIINCVLFCVFLVLIGTLQPMRWGRTKWTQSYFDVHIPKTVDLNKPAIVLIVKVKNTWIMSYLRPFFPANWHFIYTDLRPFYFYDLNWRFDPNVLANSVTHQWINRWSQTGKYSFFVLSLYNSQEFELNEIIKTYGFAIAGPCQPLQTKFATYFLCPIDSLKEGD